MYNFKGAIIIIALVVIIYLLDYFLPKWFGFIPSLAFLIYMIWIMIGHGNGSIVGSIIVIIIGEMILVGMWSGAVRSRERRRK
ncbi:hypothetical protein ABTQ33_01305 [Paucilactobacillus suebicus]|uniref:Integral membrane protein n=1 Tax=Paucilactobacillus suebicus DSM 5007 = KCTC 3549 TaxID=1423807 RepID=A0A0R1W3S6_9LACO|nr:hypothetical protein [Paucilactobacillus suebicus]KRM12414.1 integral membrane protein [Paucilactobacillus suebicus DSM 5007 = KCTC 3549]